MMPPIPTPAAPERAFQDAAIVPLAFDRETLLRDDFELHLREAVEAMGAILLFHLRVAGPREADRCWMAAVAFGGAGEHELAIVTLQDDGTGTIEPAERSSAPIAAIAPAFAGLVHRWAAAA